MEALPVNYVGLVAVFLIFGLPVIAVVMVFCEDYTFYARVLIDQVAKPVHVDEASESIYRNTAGHKSEINIDSFFFSDGDAISPFEEPKPKEKKVEPPETNGITDWKVGDIAIHEKFGEGVVKAIINGTIIVVEFAEHGKKTLLSNHPLLSRKASKGGLA